MGKINVNCPACEASLVYGGFLEKRGEAIPCNTCNNKGYVEAEVFEGIKPKLHIREIRIDDEHGEVVMMPYDEYIRSRANN